MRTSSWEWAIIRSPTMCTESISQPSLISYDVVYTDKDPK